jgi:RNA polymerase sigma-70 factor (ECF subfamily)
MQARDESALEILYDRYAGLIYTVALRIVGDRDLADEVLQDAFLRCWSGAGQFDPERGRLGAWLMGITRNRAIDLLRGRQHQARLREQELLPEAGARGGGRNDDPGHIVVVQQTVAAALQDLPPAQRQVLEMSYFGGLTQTEIASRLDTPLGTVKSHMRRGLDRMRGFLAPGEETTGEEGIRLA